MSVSLTVVSVANSIIFCLYPSIGILGVRSWSSELELENVFLGIFGDIFLGTDPTIANKIKGSKGSVPRFSPDSLPEIRLFERAAGGDGNDAKGNEARQKRRVHSLHRKPLSKLGDKHLLTW